MAVVNKSGRAANNSTLRRKWSLASCGVLRPSSRTGSVDAGAPVAQGTVELLTDPSSRKRPTRILRRKYGLEYVVVMGIEPLTRPRHCDRIKLRITPA